MDTTIAEELRRTILFSPLREQELASVAQMARPLSLGRGEQLFAMGEPARHFFYLAQGQIKLFRLSPDGDEKVLELIRPGQTFAEAMAFMQRGSAYPVFAEAVEESRLYGFDNEAFAGLLRGSVESCFAIMAALARRLHGCINEIEALSLHNARYRLVHFLLQNLPADSRACPRISLPTTKHVIAARLSIQPETFSRLLKALVNEGLLRVEGTEIELMDVAALRALAE